jgi:hypothetical protein
MVCPEIAGSPGLRAEASLILPWIPLSSSRARGPPGSRLVAMPVANRPCRFAVRIPRKRRLFGKGNCGYKILLASPDHNGRLPCSVCSCRPGHPKRGASNWGQRDVRMRAIRSPRYSRRWPMLWRRPPASPQVLSHRAVSIDASPAQGLRKGFRSGAQAEQPRT